MASIKCVIGSGKIDLICKIHFIAVYYSHTYDLPFHTDKVAIDDRLLFKMADSWVSIRPSQCVTAHWPLLHLVLWYRDRCYFSSS